VDKEFKDALEGMKKGFEDFKAANDQAQAGNTEKLTQVDKILASLQESVDAVQAKFARQSEIVAADAETLKALDGINLVRAKQGKAPMVASDLKNYSETLAKFMRKRCDKSAMSDAELKALREGVDSEGGFWVLPQMSSTIIGKDWETSPMENFATIENTTSNRFGYFVDFDEFGADYTKELRSRSTTENAKLGKMFIDVHTTYLKIPVSNELLEDSGTDVGAWVMRKANEKETRLRNANYINGSGEGEECF